MSDSIKTSKEQTNQLKTNQLKNKSSEINHLSHSAQSSVLIHDLNSEFPRINPYELFEQWYSEAEKKEIEYPDAAALATVSEEGRPSVRIVLVKKHGPEGFVFYTNLGSQKARELLSNPNAELCFLWKSLKRQLRISGTMKSVQPEEADQYFASRPKISQLGAWASKQSQPLIGRFELEKRVAQRTAEFGVSEVPRPPWWSGFRLFPDKFEFWQEKPFRLHERFVVRLKDKEWIKQELFP